MLGIELLTTGLELGLGLGLRVYGLRFRVKGMSLGLGVMGLWFEVRVLALRLRLGL